MQQYKRTGDLKIGAMEVALSDVEKTQKLAIEKVTPGGAAEAAKVADGDEVVAVDGNDLSAMAPESAKLAFMGYVRYHSPGEKVVLTVNRGGQKIDLTVTLGESKPPEPPKPEWAPIPPKKKTGPAAYVLI